MCARSWCRAGWRTKVSEFREVCERKAQVSVQSNSARICPVMQAVQSLIAGEVRMKRTPLIMAALILLAPTLLLGEEAPRVLHVGLVARDTIGITVQAGRVEYGEQVPYVMKPGDTVDDSSQNLSVRRNGRFLGWLVGQKRSVLYTEDRLVGEMPDEAWLDKPASYSVVSADDSAYAKPAVPVAVYRKSKPSDFARWGGWPYKAAIRHVLYLKLRQPLTVGKKYTVHFEGERLDRQAFVYDPLSLRSEAVHVSHLGFRPDDPAKVAFLSCWLGSGGAATYPNDLAFRVLGDDGREAFSGTVAVSRRASEPEDAYKKNYNGTDVGIMDFTPVRKPGKYRVSVEGIGCSYEFEISDDVWRKAFRVSARGFYHQRSGIELGPPYTDYRRPRCFHPDDGVIVYHSTCPLMDSGNGLNAKGTDTGNFGNLVAGKTDRVVTNAWGGYMDAGDWDRRIQHLIVSRYLIDLAELFPDPFSSLSLNIPESTNDLPDVVDEALFNLDCYRRMQTPAGGIRGGIESAEHPRNGECSWQESLDVMAYAPGVWSSYVYAGVAAQAASWLSGRKPRLAAQYEESAVRAMEWAEASYDAGANYPHQVRDARNLAAADLFRLTGNEKWHELFLKTTIFTQSGKDLFEWQKHEQREAPWVYLRTKRPGMNEELKGNCREAIIREADNRVRNGRQAAFRWAKYEWQPGMWGAFTAPDGVSLARAHMLTNDEKYLRALVLACQAGAGANPLNICYTTGLGHLSPRHPLHIDSRLTHQAPPPGLTVGGPIDVESHKDYWAQKIVALYCYPPVREWPTLEAYWDVFWYPPMCEFTVHDPMAGNAYVWGYLAGRTSGATN